MLRDFFVNMRMRTHFCLHSVGKSLFRSGKEMQHSFMPPVGTLSASRQFKESHRRAGIMSGCRQFEEIPLPHRQNVGIPTV